MRFLLFVLFLTACNEQKIYPQKGEIVEAVYGLGSVASEEVFHAKSAIVNSVAEFYVTEGEDVVKGQKLFKTDQGSLISSPINGRVTEIPVSIRENLFPQSTILTVVNLNKLYLSVSLEQQGAMQIRNGLTAEISFEFFRNRKLFGKIKSIYPVGDEFIAKVTVDEWPQGILTGMTADVAFEIERKKEALTVPVRAIINGHILVKRENKKIKLPVQVGLMDLEKAEIVNSDLKLTDEIVLP
ncbi:MAG: efflux RND transporter periplasmic adaptor subunit [Bacteriovoracaceae bacterium]|nr:efflux RND transporter periplasmic adaptor subunit [Bacteriovoracaceae bacterium]